MDIERFKIGRTSSKDSNMSMLGWWIVQTIVLPVLTIFLTVLMTIAAARASNPDVGSSINTIDGLATSSMAIVRRFRCSVDNPSTPGRPTKAPFRGMSSTSCITSSTNAWECAYPWVVWCWEYMISSNQGTIPFGFPSQYQMATAAKQRTKVIHEWLSRENEYHFAHSTLIF